MDFFIKTYYIKTRKYEEISEEPQILSIDDLLFGFKIWLACCISSFAVFLAEITWCKLMISFNSKPLAVRVSRKSENCAKVHPLIMDVNQVSFGVNRNVLKAFKILQKSADEKHRNIAEKIGKSTMEDGNQFGSNEKV